MKSGTPSARTAGLLIAGAVGLILTGVVIVVAVSSKPSSNQPARNPLGGVPDGAGSEGVEPPVVDVTDVTESLQNGQRGKAELYAKDDPGRITAHLEWDRFEPKPGGWIDLIQPRVWLYTKDGRTVYVRAEQATLKTPSLQQAPESGVLREAVVIKLFARRGEGETAPIDPDTDASGLMAVTDSLAFDMLLSELSTPDHVRVETEIVQAEWTGLTARFSQTKQSLEYARFDSDGDVWVYPRANEGSDEADEDDEEFETFEDVEAEDEPAAGEGTVARIERATGELSPQVQAETPKQKKHRRKKARAKAEAEETSEQVYQAVFADDVRVTRGSVSLDADVMRVLLRTINGKLPDNAFGDATASTMPERQRHVERRFAAVSDGHVNVKAVALPRPAEPGELLVVNEPSSFGQGVGFAATQWPMRFVAPANAQTPSVIVMGGTDESREEEAFRLYEPATMGELTQMWVPDVSAFGSSLWPMMPMMDERDAHEWAEGEAAELTAHEPVKPMVNDPTLPIHLTWSGVLEVLSIQPAQAPDELVATGKDANHLSVRWISESDRPVLVRESASGGWAECDTLDYHATTRTIGLIRGQDERADVEAWVEWPGTARGAFDHIAVNLGTGVGLADGAGMIATTGVRDETRHGPLTDAQREAIKAKPLPKHIAWKTSAAFALRTRNGWVGSGLNWAEFEGDVLAQDERSSLSGETVRVDFEHNGEHSPSRLAKLTVDGDAVAMAEAGDAAARAGEMRADLLEVEFVSDQQGQTEPASVWAQGHVSTSKDGDVVSGDTLQAELMRDARGKVGVSRAEVRGEDGSARIARRDGSIVKADRVVAHASKNTADVFGSPALLEKDGAKIFGNEMSLRAGTDTDAQDGAELFVFGPGRFEMETTAQSDVAGRSAVATWTKSMSYNDATGRLDCSGEAKVESWQGPLSVDRMAAERVYIDIAASSGEDKARRVRRVEAVGSIVEEDGGVNAHVESRRYVLGDDSSSGAGESDGKRLVQLFYLEGPRIIGDNAAQTLSVPAAGRAVIVDRRDQGELDRVEGAAGGSPLVNGQQQGPSGTSRFVWAGSALFTRGTGVLDLIDGVELVNKPEGNQPLIRLTCARLLATIIEKSGDSTGDATSLRSVEAIGSIYTQQDGTSLTADRLIYDAPTDVIVAEATGDRGRQVSMTDAKNGTPVLARSLKWNLRTDRVDILVPAGVNTPR